MLGKSHGAVWWPTQWRAAVVFEKQIIMGFTKFEVIRFARAVEELRVDVHTLAQTVDLMNAGATKTEDLYMIVGQAHTLYYTFILYIIWQGHGTMCVGGS